MEKQDLKLDCNNLLMLPEDILGRILFSGYLSTKWYWTVCLCIGCKKLNKLGKIYISHVDNVNRFGLDSYHQTKIELNVLKITSIAENVVYLDLGFSKLDFTSELGNMIVSMKGTLRGLSLRGTGVKDEFVEQYIGKLHHLRYLNISQYRTVDKVNITDQSAETVSKLTQLKWLNISMTNITSVTIDILQQKCIYIQHIDMFGCKLLTNEIFPLLSNWKLHTLDISNCPLLTITGFEELCNNR